MSILNLSIFGLQPKRMRAKLQMVIFELHAIPQTHFELVLTNGLRDFLFELSYLHNL